MAGWRGGPQAHGSRWEAYGTARLIPPPGHGRMGSLARRGPWNGAALPGRKRRVPTVPVHLTLVLALVGCSPNITSNATDEVPAWFETDRHEYHWEPVTHGPDSGLRVEIPVTFTNRSDAPVAIFPCVGLRTAVLERRDRGRWVRAWSPIIAAVAATCTVAPKATYVDTVRVVGFFPPSGIHPVFEREDLEGDFRFVWPGVYADSVLSPVTRTPPGPPLPPETHRSNTFHIRMP